MRSLGLRNHTRTSLGRHHVCWGRPQNALGRNFAEWVVVLRSSALLKKRLQHKCLEAGTKGVL